jgi:hypothetical protein
VALWRCADTPDAYLTTLDFPDADTVSDYARKALLWASEWGILTGTDAGTLSPGEPATRIQVAQMLMKYLNGATLVEF